MPRAMMKLGMIAAKTMQRLSTVYKKVYCNSQNRKNLPGSEFTSSIQ
eukprot:CAMPEP_0170196176 /NCGR_PEP_ID=MMETSP0040_2-20121228/63236_1 /TAXON_ID=641309 /ORGANISM="Lotharella oceanica, Strain CCMP622" /LENGTH=46 /DNA_ID= /DNA_START= /DNA_END= /DNA_ORIENTATION=